MEISGRHGFFIFGTEEASDQDSTGCVDLELFKAQFQLEDTQGKTRDIMDYILQPAW